MSTPIRPRTIDETLAEARSRLRRLTPVQAVAAYAQGGVLVDIRPKEQRRCCGQVPYAVPIERNVLEWRFDPTRESALPIADCDLHVIVLFQEGYTSSLAAVALQDLGIRRATDVIGGYAAYLEFLDRETQHAFPVA